MLSVRVFCSEVEAVVVAAAGVEGGFAVRALVVAVHVLVDGEFFAATAAKDGFCVPCGLRPEFDFVIG